MTSIGSLYLEPKYPFIMFGYQLDVEQMSLYCGNWLVNQRNIHLQFGCLEFQAGVILLTGGVLKKYLGIIRTCGERWWHQIMKVGGSYIFIQYGIKHIFRFGL